MAYGGQLLSFQTDRELLHELYLNMEKVQKELIDQFLKNLQAKEQLKVKFN